MRKLVLLVLGLGLFAAFAVSAQETVYVSARSAKVREQPSTSAVVMVTVRRGAALDNLGSAEGTRVSGSTAWYHVRTADGIEGYVHSSLVTTTAPAVSPAPTSPTVRSNSSCPSNPTCSSLTCNQAYACLAAGYGGLDRDKDGVPCESVCPGG
jgi:uncharacterized protein YgiM (DUF1202 family)